MSKDTAVTREATRDSQSQRNESSLIPPVDVVEDSSGITLYADLPGVSKDKLNLNVEAGTLTIEGDLGLATPEGMEATYAEVGLARFRRVFSLSKDLDTAKVSAELAQGVLRLRIPKAEHAQPRKIEVRVN